MTMKVLNLRQVLLVACLALVVACDAPPASANRAVVDGSDPWAQVPQILKRIVPPTFPARDFDITKYGAVADGKADCTQAFRDAIAACTKAGGGRVVVPAGRFLTGPIHLRHNVNLHVTKDATILFSKQTADYMPVVFTRFECMEVMNYSPLIYAFEQQNMH